MLLTDTERRKKTSNLIVKLLRRMKQIPCLAEKEQPSKTQRPQEIVIKCQLGQPWSTTKLGDAFQMEEVGRDQSPQGAHSALLRGEQGVGTPDLPLPTSLTLVLNPREPSHYSFPYKVKTRLRSFSFACPDNRKLSCREAPWGSHHRKACNKLQPWSVRNRSPDHTLCEEWSPSFLGFNLQSILPTPTL